MIRVWFYLLFYVLSVKTNELVYLKSSLTFVIDVTSSMDQVRQQVEDNAHAVFDTVMESNDSYIDNFILVTFADPDRNPLAVVNVTNTKDRDEFKASLSLTMVKGHDCPEYSMSGIQRGIEESNFGSTIFIFTDASAKDYEEYDYIKKISLEKQIQLIFLLTGQCKYHRYPYEGYAVYEKLATVTTGQVFNLRKRDINDTIEFIKKSVSSRRILFAAITFDGKDGIEFNYTNDHATKNTIIAISCSLSSLDIKDPDETSVAVTNLLKLDNVTVVNVHETKMGMHTVTIGCSENSKNVSRVLATAESYIQFSRGFSAYRPVSLRDTTTTPSPNGETYLLIQVKGNFRAETVHLIDVSGSLIPGYILNLFQLEDSNKLFVTDPFKAPSLFRIVVFGVNLDNKENISRTDMFLVEQQNPSFAKTNDTIPIITIEGSPIIIVEMDTPLQLKCSVVAYPKPNITWESNGDILETGVFDYKLPNEFVSVHKIQKTTTNATYKCTARNELGKHTKTIQVQANLKHYYNVQKTPEDKVHVVAYNDEAKFICQVDTYPPATVNWYKNGFLITKDDVTVSSDSSVLTIDRMQPSDEGHYTCEVKYASTNYTYPFDVKISGVAPTKIRPTPNALQTVEFSNKKLSCSIEDGTPRPTIKWFYKDKTATDFDEIEESSDQEELSLGNVHRNDSGTYKCVAQNVMNTDTMEFTLVVEYPPTVDVSSTPMSAKAGTQVTLACAVDGVPEPVVVWRKDGKALIDSKFVFNTDHSIIFAADLADRGDYECHASNKLGYDNKTVLVEVLKEPTAFINVSDPIDAEYGEPLNITCEVYGYPEPDIMWTDVTNMINFSAVSEEESPFHFVSQLQLATVTANATFQCRANNTLGDSEQQVSVETVRKPHFKMLTNPEDKVYDVPYNTTSQFRCEADAYPSAEVDWFKNGHLLPKDDVTVSSDGSVLTIDHMQPGDDGHYTCEVKNAYINNTFSFDVKISGVAPTKIRPTPNALQTVEFSNKKLSCSIEDGTPRPTIKWFYKDKTATDFVEIEESSDQEELSLANVHRNDSGTYKCVAQNVMNTDTMEFTLVVEYPPTVDVSSTPMSAKAGTQVTLACAVDGVPEPIVVWRKDGKALTDSKFVSNTDHSIIFAADLADRGDYECHASNKLGYDSKTVLVEVLKEPTAFINVSDPIDAEYGEPLNITCEVYGYPEPDIMWTDVTNMINFSAVSEEESPFHFVSQLQLATVTANATFQCRANNTLGDSEQQVSVETVNYIINNTFPFDVKISGVAPTKIRPTPNALQTVEFSNKKLSCSIEDGTPRPTIKWFYKDKTATDFVEIEESSDQEELSLANVHRNDSGTYKCVAQNVMNTDTMEFTLVVEYPPTVDVSSTPMSAKAGTQVTLACAVDGVPEPIVVWRMDGKALTDSKFVSNTDHSIIFAADLADRGDYECHASNKLGYDSKTVLVEVLKEPTAFINVSDPIDAEYGEPLNITCEVYGYPEPDIMWTDVTNMINFSAVSEEESPFHFVSQLQLATVTANATFQCRANNTLGDSEQQVSVETVRKPHFKMLTNPEDKVYDVPYNTTSQFRCEADAYPSAEVDWFKNGHLLPKDDVTVSSDGSVLTIDHMQPGDDGHYTCEVKNAYINNTFPFDVKISGVAPTKIRPTPNALQTVEFSNKKLSCSIEDGTPRPTIKWFYKDKTATDFVEIEESSDQEELSLANVHRNDSGTYKCVAQNVMNTDTMEFTLVVEYPPTVDVSSTPMSAKAGTQVTLACAVDGVPEPIVVWRKDGKALTDSKFVSNTDHSIIFAADLADRGDYECHASNKLGYDNKTVLVEVLKEPTAFINVSDPIDAEYGEPLNITCEVYGYPEPDIMWTDVTNMINFSAVSEKESPFHFVSQLQLATVTANATFQCRANNTLGDSGQQVSVETVRKPHFKMLTNPEDKVYDVPYNTTSQFRCEADAYPSAEVDWFKNGHLLPKDDVTVSSDGSVLTIDHMQPGDDGHYTCEVKNAYINNTFPFDVKISGVAPTKIRPTPNALQAVEFSNKKLSCSIEDGTPRPTIKWFYKDKTATDFVEIEESSDQEELSLANVHRNDSGTYKCVAQNVMNTDTMEFTLVVEYPPTVDVSSTPMSAKAGTQVTLACAVDGVPEPIVVWRKDGKALTDSKFVSNTDHSIIFAADLADRGDYECHASNKLGYDNKTVLVEVLKEPTAFINVSDPIDAEYGEPLNITCEVYGYPEPDIMWTDVTNMINFSAVSEKESPFHFVSQLQLATVTANATFQCRANNTLGDSGQQVSVETVRKPHFKMLTNPEDKVYDVPYNTTSQFRCEADAYPSAEVDWFKNGHLLPKDDVTVSSDGSVLTIDHMQPGDDGHYTCEVKNAYINNTFPFDVKISGVAPTKIRPTPNALQAVEFSNKKLSCSIEDGTPRPTIKWFYKDKTATDFVEIEESSDQEELSLANVHRNDSGTYKCVAQNVMNTDTMEFTLVVEYPPTVDVSSTPMSAKAGTQVTLACAVDGVPEPIVVWRKDGKALTDSKFVSNTDHSIIFAADLADRGDYECHASNKLGYDNKTVLVEVLKEPTAFINVSDPIDAEYGEPLNITCEVYGYPEPDIMWTDVTNMINFSAVSEKESPFHFVSQLQLATVTANATFQCRANNTLGDSGQQVSVETVRKPHFKMLTNPEDKVYDVPYNTTSQFRCEADAYPSAEVDWFKNGHLLPKDDVTVSSDGSVLTIDHMQPGDDGHYTCEVKNAYINNTFPFDVKISGVAPTKIRPTPNALQTVEFSNKKLSCSIEDGTPRPTIKWFYKDKTATDFVEIEESSDQEELSLANVYRNDSGTYKCVAQNVMNTDTMEFTLVVEYPPTVDVSSTPMSAKAGTQVTLACAVDGVPEPIVVWRKDGKALTDSKFVSNTDHSIIFAADLADRGDYECHASNKLGYDNKTVLVEVLKEPTAFINVSDPIDAEYGEPLNITCEVYGYPEPDIMWTDVTNMINFSAVSEKESPFHFVSQLQLATVTANATFQCRANNTLGDSGQQVSVETVRKPHFKMLTNPEDKVYDVPYNTTSQFRCEADAYPSAEVDWFKNGHLLPKDDVTVSSDGSVLTIDHMQPGDDGHYTCEVKNAYINNTFPFDVKISGVAPTKIRPTPNALQAVEFSNKKLSCSIEDGTPRPTIKWFYKDKTATDFVEIEESSDQEELSLANVHRNDSGTYKCVAQNVMNTDTMEFTLVVEYPPTVDVSSTPMSAKAGTQVTLACAVDGVPEPIVVWRKDGKALTDSKFVSNTDHSIIFAADLADRGDYECHASNKLGYDNKTVLVEVLKEPTAFINVSDPIDAEYGEPLNITCEVYGYPEPDIMWTDVTNMINFSAVSEEESPFHFVSQIQLATVTANATFQCRANNTLGDSEQQVSVETVRKPHFKMLTNPEDKVYDVPYNTTSQFRCEADAYPSAEVDWFKNGHLLPKDDVTVSSDGSVLTIDHMQPGDDGHYTCEVKNAYINNTFPFDVKISGVAPTKIRPTPNALQTVEFSNKKLSCSIEDGTPRPTIKWFYKNKTATDFVEIEESSDQEELSLANVHRNDSGTYKCVAQNVMNTDTMEFTLVVEYPPTVDVSSTPMSAKAGTQVTLACAVDGVPEPIVVWRKDGKALTDSKFVSNTDHSIIFAADLADRGDYECHASNKLGYDNKTVLVEVLKEPTAFINVSDPIDAEYGEPLNITCEVYGYPEPDIMWTDVTNMINFSAVSEEESPFHFVSQLQLATVTANATFQCRANNTLGDSEQQVSVETVRKPHFKMLTNPEDKVYDVPYNTTSQFRCEADAYPSAEVDWFKNGHLLPKDDVTVSSDGSVLTIDHMQPGDDGHYTCEVKNAYINNTFPFDVKISGLAKPKITPTLKILYVPENSAAKINCRIEEGNPFPNIEWYYKDMAVKYFRRIENATDEDFLLPVVNKKDIGTYQCIAKNIIDSDMIEFELIGEYVPTIVNDTETMIVETDSMVVLKCQVDGFPPPNVEWKRDEKPLLESRFVSNADHDVIFTAGLDDRGVYKCSASNKLGTAIKTVNVEVEKEPSVTIEGNSIQQVDYNDELHLKCNVIGNPTPIIWWSEVSTGKVLSSSTTLVKFPYESLSILIVTKTVESTSYQCTARNIHGIDNATVNIEIKKYFYVTTKPKDTVIPYNTEGKLVCKVDSYPKAEILWYHKNKMLRNNDDYKISDDNTTLTIVKIQPSQNGAYSCSASNTESKTKIDANVKITGIEKPKILTRTYYQVKEGNNVELQCNIVTGIPKPTLKWYIQKKNSKHYTEIVEARNQDRYMAINVRRDGNNKYACGVKNYYGQDFAKIKIQVEYPPTISPDKTVFNVKNNGKVTIPCLVDGIPLPSVEWVKTPSTATLAAESDHSLNLITSMKDSGTYTCIARNKHGTAKRIVTINVYYIVIANTGNPKQHIDEYDTLKLRCNAYGNPTPKMEWFYKGTDDKPKHESVKIPLYNIQYDQRGYYTCVASNKLGGHETFTYNVDVYTGVTIHNTEQTVRGVVGDIALNLFCNATGNPPPNYKWTLNGSPVKENSNTLSFRNVKKSLNTKEIVCEARNDNDGQDTFKFVIEVSDYPWLNNINTTIKVKVGETVSLTCPISHRKSDYIRWYKGKTKLPRDLIISKVRSTDAGIYTCRVSNLAKSESANVIIEVESKLKFVNASVETSLYLGFGEMAVLDCSAVTVNPNTKTSWAFNGNAISSYKYDILTFNMTKALGGRYTCEVTENRDTISRTFEVSLDECVIRVDDNPKQPLILTSYFSLPPYKYDNGLLYIPKQQTILLVCPRSSKLNILNYNHHYTNAYCNIKDKKAQLEIDGGAADTDIQCTQEIKPQVKWTGTHCYGLDSKTVKVVFEELSKTVEVYEVCVDTFSYDTPLYTKQRMHLPVAENIPKTVSWSNNGLRQNFDKFYDVDGQISTIESILGLSFHETDRCVFSKRQLVNSLDVFPGLPQRATFSHLNVVPFWSTCSAKNWDEVETRVRKLAHSSSSILTVWTGTYMDLKMKDVSRDWADIYLSNPDDRSSQAVSTYIWKVVQDPEKASSLAIIQLNVPDIRLKDVPSYVICPDICHQITWLQGNTWKSTARGYIFCCRLKDFEKAFRYEGHNIFGSSMYDVLR